MFFNVYLFLREREREHTNGEGAERAGPQLQAVSAEPDMGLKPTNHDIMTQAEVRCSTD